MNLNQDVQEFDLAFIFISMKIKLEPTCKHFLMIHTELNMNVMYISFLLHLCFTCN